MSSGEVLNPEKFLFRGLHPDISIGTASDRYAGWMGQIYSPSLYENRISRRTHTVGGKSFVEQVLPVDSVEEFFEHFRVLELDYTFYGLLLEDSGEPTRLHRVLQSYRDHLREGDRIILKAPQITSARKLRHGGVFVPNSAYLDHEIFTRRFYAPALELLGDALAGIVFEQEYHRKADRSPPADVAKALDGFFSSIPNDNRYHIELRTDSYLAPPVFKVLERHGVGQVFSHWTWLPSLREQFSRAGRRFLNSGNHAVIRLMTPRGVRYEDAYARAQPFNRLIEEMLNPDMLQHTVELIQAAIDRKVKMNVIINNRAGGNAPMIAGRLVEQFLNAGKGRKHRDPPNA